MDFFQSEKAAAAAQRKKEKDALLKEIAAREKMQALQNEMEEKYKALQEAMEASKKELEKSKEDVDALQGQLKEAQVRKNAI